MCFKQKLHGYDRSRLIGKVHEYSVDDFIAYLVLRINYLLSAKGETNDTQKNKLTIDFPVIARQIEAWVDKQNGVIVQSSDSKDHEQLSRLLRRIEEVLLIREGMLRSFSHVISMARVA